MEGHGPSIADQFATGALMLGGALLAVLLFRRLGLGAVLGYLIAGLALGPHGLGLVGDAETILSFAELGIILLLFLVGLELAPARLWRMKRDIFGLGMSQVVLCGLAITALLLLVTSFSWGAALALGLPLALSSTAQVLPMLQSAGRLNTPLGERAFAILLFQDLSIVPLLTIVGALSRAPASGAEQPAWMVAALAIPAIAALILAGRYILSPLLRIIGEVAERELFIVAGLLAVFGSAALMHAIGLSPALGAFLAGVMLADSPFRHELESDIDPFRSILLGLFFLAVGMMLDLGVIMERPWFVIGMAAALVATKIAIIFALARLFGFSSRPALILGLLLSQGGEFGFVLFAEAARGQLIAPEAASLFNAIVTLSMATTPFLMLLTRRFGGVAGAVRREDGPDDEIPPASAIIVGHGRFGQTVAGILAGASMPITLIDRDPNAIERSERFGRKVFYGDGTRIDLLRRAGGDQARLIFLCIDDRSLSAEALAPIVAAFPNAKVFVRVFDRLQYLTVKAAGAAGLQRELMESSIRMAVDGLESIDVDHAVIERVVDEFRRRDRERLRAQHVEGDLGAGRHLSFGTVHSMAFDPANPSLATGTIAGESDAPRGGDQR